MDVSGYEDILIDKIYEEFNNKTATHEKMLYKK